VLTTTDGLVIHVCPAVGLGRDRVSLDLPGKGIDGNDDKSEKRRNKGEASKMRRARREGQDKAGTEALTR
jgi:hypothetical protein